MPDVYIKSPFRPDPKNVGAFGGSTDIDTTAVSDTHRVRNAIETIANFVSPIPEVSVTFVIGQFMLGTQRYGAVHDAGLVEELTAELDTIAKNAEKNLKDEEFKKVKVTPKGVDVTPMGWGSGIEGSGRTILYTAVGTYEFTAEQ